MQGNRLNPVLLLIQSFFSFWRGKDVNPRGGSRTSKSGSRSARLFTRKGRGGLNASSLPRIHDVPILAFSSNYCKNERLHSLGMDPSSAGIKLPESRIMTLGKIHHDIPLVFGSKRGSRQGSSTHPQHIRIISEFSPAGIAGWLSIHDAIPSMG